MHKTCISLKNRDLLSSKVILTLLTLFLLSGVVEAQSVLPSVTIGSGTEVDGSIPTYVCSNQSLSQQIYTVTELGGVAGSILTLDFYYEKDKENTWNPIEQFSRDLDIYIVSTDKTSFESDTDLVDFTSGDLCFSGSVTFCADAWTTITLDTPFSYDGSSNIIVIVHDKSNISMYEYIPFRVFEADRQCIYADDEEIDPADPLNISTWYNVSCCKSQIRINTLPDIPRPKSLTANYNDSTAVALSWTSDNNTFEISVNGVVQPGTVSGTSYTLKGLQYKTEYTIKVRAKDGGNVSEWSDSVRFTTVYCAPENMCKIIFELSDENGDGWGESAITVKVVDDGFILGKVTFQERWGSKTDTLNVPDGKEIVFLWSSAQYGYGQWESDCSYIVKNHNGVVIFSGEDALPAPVYHNVDCASTAMPCDAPTNLTVTAVRGDSATLNWDGNNYSYEIQMKPWIQVGHDVAVADALTTYSFDLSDYKGRGSVVIRHYDVTGQARLLIDDILLTDSLGQTILSEDFEKQSYSDLITTLDKDGDGFCWDYGHYGEETDPHGNRYFNGRGGMDSDSWREYHGDLTPDDWFIISGVELGGTLSLKARGYDDRYKENFGVYVCLDSAATIAVNGNSYKAEHLIMDTPYSWRVRTVENGERSNWVASEFMSSADLMVFSGEGNWNNPAMWSPAGVPTYKNKVRIEGNVIIPEGVTAQAMKVIKNKNATVTINEGGQLKQGASSLRVLMKKSVKGGTDNIISSPIIGRTNILRMGFDIDWVEYLVESDNKYDLYAFDPTCQDEWINGKITDYYATYNESELFRGGMQWGNGYYYSYKDDLNFTYDGPTWPSHDTELREDMTYDPNCKDEFNGWKLVGNPFTCYCEISYSKKDAAVFYRYNRASNMFDLYSGSVVLSPGEGAFISVTESGSIIYSSEAPAMPATSFAIGRYPFLPQKSLTIHQDAGSFKLTEADGIAKLMVDFENYTDLNVSFTRSFSKDKASTICLPFSIDSIIGGSLYEFVDVTYDAVEGWVATMQSANLADAPTVAGKPYLYMPDENGYVTFKGYCDVVPNTMEAGQSAAVHSGGDGGTWTFYGTYSNIVWDPSMGTFYGFAANSYDGGDYTVNPGMFVKAKSGAEVPPFRCYLTYSGSSLKGQLRGTSQVEDPMPDTIKIVFRNSGGTVTAVGSMNTATGSVTIDSWFDMNGHELPAAPAEGGLYIRNGRKVMLKRE